MLRIKDQGQTGLLLKKKRDTPSLEKLQTTDRALKVLQAKVSLCKQNSNLEIWSSKLSFEIDEVNAKQDKV